MRINDRHLALFPTAAICLYWLWRTAGFGLHDFANYYFGGHFAASGQFGKWIYFPAEFNREIALLAPGIFSSFAPNSPFVAAVFAPFSYLQPGIAKLIFGLIGISLLLCSIARISKFLSVKPIWLLLIPIVFFQPIRNGILFGQVYFVMLFLLTEGFIAIQKGRRTLGAFLFAFAAALKVFPAALIVYLIASKRYREAFLMTGFGFALIALTLPLTGIESWTFWLSEVMPRASAGNISVMFVDNYNSPLMFLRRVFIDHRSNTGGLGFPWLAPALDSGLKAFVFVAGFFITFANRNKIKSYCYWIVAILLISPYGSTYGFVLLLVPFLYLAANKGSKSLIGLFVIFLISNLPMPFLDRLDFPFSYLRLALLLTLYLLFYTRISVVRTIVAVNVSLIVAMISAITFSKVEVSPLLNEQPVLVTDFEIKNEILRYKFFDENGSQTAELKLSDALANSSKTQIQKSEIPNIRKRLVYKDTEIILADHGRGIGFFTLYISNR